MMELTLEESLSMFMTKIAKRLDENTNLIKELQASTDFALRNQEASIKALMIQGRKMSIELHEKLSRDLRSSTIIKPRVDDETISTSVETEKPSIHHIDASQYAETDEGKDLEAHYTNAKPLGKALPRKEKDPGSFTLPCFIKNMCYKALAELGASSTKLGLETRLMGNELRKNKLQDPKFEDFIKLNDLNEPIEHRRNQVKVFVPTIKEGEGMDEPIIEDIETMFDNIGYNEDECEYLGFCNFCHP
ncbi:hypothetical protein Tco_1467517 [Tanacetum coccineum]